MKTKTIELDTCSACRCTSDQVELVSHPEEGRDEIVCLECSNDWMDYNLFGESCELGMEDY